jgi:thymidylate kinase
MKENSFISNLFSQLIKEDIEYCVLRNYQSLPKHSGGSDIDLWVSTKDTPHLFAILEKVKDETNSHLVSYLIDTHCPKVCYLNENEGCQIDIFKGNIYYQNNVMITEKSIETNLAYYKDIKILDDCYANIIAFLKEIINNERCDDKYIMPIYANKNVYQKEYLQIQCPLFTPLFIERFYNAIQKEDITKQMSVLCQLAKKSIVKKSVNFNRIKKMKRVFQRPGYVIVVLGTDGSGKSTIINAITPIINEAFHKSVIYNHLRPNVLPELGVLLGRKAKTDKPIVVTNPHAQKPSGPVGSIFRWGYYLLDYTLGYIKSVFPQIRTKSKVFIFDRYYYDYYIDQRRSRTSLPHWILRLGECLVPTPDIILCLGGDPQKIYSRKPETSLKEVTRQTRILQKFCHSRRKAVWIDTTTTPQESIIATMEAIVKMMIPRFKNTKL